jgi:hypothetical protein
MKQILRRWMSPSLAVSALALAVALSGGVAMASGLIGTNQIKNGAVTTAKLHNGAVTTTKLAGPGKYHNVGAAGVPFLNGWSNYGLGFAPARFYVDVSGVVHLEGVVQGGTASSNVFRLPTGFRPRLNHAWAVAATGGVENIDVYSNGLVFAFGPATAAVALDGISFRTR